MRFPAIIVRLLLLGALLAGCAAPSASAPPSPTATPSLASTGATPSPTAAGAAAATFPLALTDDEGNAVALAAAPKAIVALTPAATETLFALGAGDRMVGKVEDFSLYPPEAAAVPDVARFGSVDVERIVALGADLVIAGGADFNPPDQVAQLRALGVPVLTIYGLDLEAALADILLIGRAVGRSGQADALVTDLRETFARVEEATRNLPRLRVYYEIDDYQGYWGPAPDFFGVEMIRLAGGDPLTSGTPGAFQIPEERIVAFDPQVIVLGDAVSGVTAADVAARPAWAGITAVRTGAIRPVDDVIVTRPGPRLGAGLIALARSIHPEANLPSLGAALPSPLPSPTAGG